MKAQNGPNGLCKKKIIDMDIRIAIRIHIHAVITMGMAQSLGA
jgi:hypothetical protein